VKRTNNINLGSIVILFIFVVLFFDLKEVLFKGKFIFEDDMVGFFYPLSFYINQWVKRGIFPLWSQSVNCGFPLMAYLPWSILWQLVFLFSIKASPFSAVMSMDFIMLLGYWLGSVFMFFYIRGLGIKVLPSLMGACIFTFNGLWVDLYTEYTQIITFMWLPLLLLLTDKFFLKKKEFYIFALGCIIGLQFLCGEFQVFLYSTIVFLIYFLFKSFIFMKYYAKNKLGVLFRLFFAFLLIFVIAGGIAAVQLIPSYELFLRSGRALAAYQDIMAKPEDSLSLANLPVMVYPFFYALNGSFRYLYVGLFVIAFAGLGILDFTRKKFSYFYSLLAIFSLFIAMGEHSFLYSLIYALHLPGFNYLRDVYVFALVAVFSLSVLSAFGVNYVIEKKSKIESFVAAAAGLLLLVTLVILQKERLPSHVLFSFLFWNTFPLFLITIISFVSGKKHKLLFTMILLAALYMNYYVFTKPIIIHRKKKELFLEYKKYSALRDISAKDKGYYRVFVLDEDREVRNVNLIYNLDSASSRITPFLLVRYLEYTKAGFDVFSMKEYPYEKFLYYPSFLKLANVKYITTSRNYNPLLHSYLSESLFFEKIYQDRYIDIYLYKDYFPRIFFARNALIISDRQKILAKLKSSLFNPQNTAIVEEGIPLQNNRETAKQYRLKIVSYTPNRIVVNLTNFEKGMLVLLDTYYPGWKVYIDGKPSKIYRTDYLFRGVYIAEEGNHKVVFLYRPKSFFIGAAITAITLFCCIWGLWKAKNNHFFSKAGNKGKDNREPF